MRTRDRRHRDHRICAPAAVPTSIVGESLRVCMLDLQMQQRAFAPYLMHHHQHHYTATVSAAVTAVVHAQTSQVARHRCRWSFSPCG